VCYAAECMTYFDDGRVFADYATKCKQATRKVTSGIGRLGNQDATRKRRSEGKRPGAWSGACIFTDHGLPRAFIPQEKWDRLKRDVKWILDHATAGTNMPRTEFRKRRGFLVHGCSIYRWMPPYVKYVHLAHDRWRGDRDQEGWKVRPPAGSGYDVEPGSAGDITQ